MVGVGEIVMLSVEPGPLDWSLTGEGSLLTPFATETEFVASGAAGSATVLATDGSHTCTVTFTVVEPDGVIERQAQRYSIEHTKGRPDIGFIANIYITPPDVSFEFIEVREVDVAGEATGVYSPLDMSGHDADPAIHSIKTVTPGLGSLVNGIDRRYSNDPCTAPPFAPGYEEFEIPWEYRVGDGDFKEFTTVQAISASFDGATLLSSKAGAEVTTTIDAPTSTNNLRVPGDGYFGAAAHECRPKAVKR
jgi:hypothetical protein